MFLDYQYSFSVHYLKCVQVGGGELPGCNLPWTWRCVCCKRAGQVMRAPRWGTHTHVQQIDACIAGWARRQRAGNLIGAFVVLVVMVSMAHRASREDRLHIPQRKRWRICPSHDAGASLCRACRQRTLSAATALAVVASLRACCSIAFAAAAVTPVTLPPFLFGTE